MINSELLALSALQSEYPKHIITHSSAYQDMKWHYDFIITNPITSIKKYVESKYKEEGLGEFMWYEAANKYGDGVTAVRTGYYIIYPMGGLC